MLRSLPTLLAGAVLLALGLLFSVVVLVVVAVFGLGLWAWLWWKTRKLRRAANEAHTARATTAEGQVKDYTLRRAKRSIARTRVQ